MTRLFGNCTMCGLLLPRGKLKAFYKGLGPKGLYCRRCLVRKRGARLYGVKSHPGSDEG